MSLLFVDYRVRIRTVCSPL